MKKSNKIKLTVLGFFMVLLVSAFFTTFTSGLHYAIDEKIPSNTQTTFLYFFGLFSEIGLMIFIGSLINENS